MNRRGAEATKGVRHELNEWTQQIIGAAIEVHRHLGPGYLEATYEEALVQELGLRSIPFTRQVSMPITYKGQVVSEARLDLLVRDEIVVELKAVAALQPIHTAQLISYLKAGAFELGLIINFNVPLLREGIRRVILTE